MNYSTALILLLPVGGSFPICSSSKHCVSLSSRKIAWWICFIL